MAALLSRPQCRLYVHIVITKDKISEKKVFPMYLLFFVFETDHINSRRVLLHCYVCVHNVKVYVPGVCVTT